MTQVLQKHDRTWFMLCWLLALAFPLLVSDAAVAYRIIHAFYVVLISIGIFFAQVVDRAANNSKVISLFWSADTGYAKVLFFWQLVLLLSFRFTDQLSHETLSRFIAAINNYVPMVSDYAFHLSFRAYPQTKVFKVQLMLLITSLAAFWFVVNSMRNLHSKTFAARLEAYRKNGGILPALCFVFIGGAIALYMMDVAYSLEDAPKFGRRSRCLERLYCYSNNDLALLEAAFVKLLAFWFFGKTLVTGVHSIHIFWRIYVSKQS